MCVSIHILFLFSHFFITVKTSSVEKPSAVWGWHWSLGSPLSLSRSWAMRREALPSPLAMETCSPLDGPCALSDQLRWEVGRRCPYPLVIPLLPATLTKRRTSWPVWMGNLSTAPSSARPSATASVALAFCQVCWREAVVSSSSLPDSVWQQEQMLASPL